jgi:hypothetical protein
MQDLFANKASHSDSVHCVIANNSEWKLLTEHDYEGLRHSLSMKNLSADEIQE